MTARLKGEKLMNKRIGYIAALIAAVLMLNIAFVSAGAGENKGATVVEGTTETLTATAATVVTTAVTATGAGANIVESSAIIMAENITYSADIGIAPWALPISGGSTVIVGFVPTSNKINLNGFYLIAMYNGNGCSCYSYFLPYVPKRTEEGSYIMHTTVYSNNWGVATAPRDYATNVTLVRVN